nr:TetR/AcrR family transcriptional regulator [uncultured Arsenicibacter sp.]
MKVVKRRNRAMTMERILRATGEVIAERGTEKAGINSVAEKAQVNKVLIYRYFGGWNGLLEAYVQRGFFLSMFNDKYTDTLPANIPPAERDKVWSEYILGLTREFRSRKSSQDLVRWEMSHGETELARRIAQFRSEAYAKMIQKLAPYPDYDPTSITAIILAGITYLTLLSDQGNPFIGIDLQSDAGWDRIEKGVERIHRSLNRSLIEKEEEEAATK